MTSPSTTASPGADDASLLRTAAGLVVLAASAYDSLRTLPAVGGGTTGGGGPGSPPDVGAVLRAHVDDAVTSLRAARAALGEATRTAGGQVRQDPDPTYAALVSAALPTLGGPADVVGLALLLEDALAQTLVAVVTRVGDPSARGLTAGLATDAAARKARLLVLSSLLGARRGDLVAAPPDLAALPASVGTVGFPDASFPTDKAVPAGGSS